MRTSTVLAFCLLLAGCNLAPDYKVPETPQPVAFKETGPWVQTTPENTLPRQAWWKLYDDATLNGLEDRIETANPTLAQEIGRAHV